MFLIFAFLWSLWLTCAAQAQDMAAPPPSTPSTIVQIDITPQAQAELDAFYALRNNKSVWNLTDEAAMKRTTAFIDSVAGLVAYHGLEADAYPLADMQDILDKKSDADKPKLELLITSSLLRLAHDLHGDDVNLDTLYTGWNFHRTPVDIPTQLNTAINTGTLSGYFTTLAPQSQTYRYLSRALQAYVALAAKGEWPTITPGAPIRPHDHDPRVPQLRARLAAEGYTSPQAPSGQENIFDDDLVKSLITYQTRNGLLTDGHAGGKTVEALNVPLADRIAQIRANMERWRHMPEDFPPDRYTVVNIPDFSISVAEDGKEIYRGIVIDGRPDRQTPFINSRIVNMLVNPSWHVPPKLAKKDILPKLRKDPHYLEKLGFVIAGRDSDPAGTQINWKNLSADKFPYTLRQNPGDLNSLGQLKFNFNNPFDVYMHGTPHQELFEKAERDFSSGCVRLEDPERVGEILLSHNKDKKGTWTQQRIGDEIDTGKTYFIPLATPMPIYFLYWSVFIGDDGQANFRKDIYGYDLLLIQKMKVTANQHPVL